MIAETKDFIERFKGTYSKTFQVQSLSLIHILSENLSGRNRRRVPHGGIRLHHRRHRLAERQGRPDSACHCSSKGNHLRIFDGSSPPPRPFHGCLLYTSTKIDEEIFKPLFPEGKKSGRPNASIRILVAMSVLKEGFGCSDEDLFEKCEFDLLTRKALGMELLTDVTPSIDTYYLFRRRICEYQERTGIDLMQDVYKRQVREYAVSSLL